MTEVLLELVKMAGAGLIAGLFASALANRDHRHRKWWEMKVAAYREVIEALSDLVHYYDNKYSAAIEHREIPEEHREELSKYFKQAYPRVRKAADSGMFLFSEPVSLVLGEFLKDDEIDWYEDHLDLKLSKAKTCLQTLVTCSQSDLKLKTGFKELLFDAFRGL